MGLTLNTAVDVVLDSNVLVADFWLSSAALRVPLREGALGRQAIVVPEVVLLETVNRYQQRLSEVRSQLEPLARELQYLSGLRKSFIASTASVADLVARYRASLLRSLRRSQAVIPQLIQPDIEETINRLIARRKPFRAEGQGFADFLIWERVVERERSTASKQWRSSRTIDATSLPKRTGGDSSGAGIRSGTPRVGRRQCGALPDRT